jgi:hypothetical protein
LRDATIDSGHRRSRTPTPKAVAGITVGEQAYYQALYGDFVTVDADGNLQKRAPQDGSAPTTSSTKSCSQQASDEVYGATADTVPAADPFTDLESEMSAMWDRIENDQRVLDAAKKWSDCSQMQATRATCGSSDAMGAVDSRPVMSSGRTVIRPRTPRRSPTYTHSRSRWPPPTTRAITTTTRCTRP